MTKIRNTLGLALEDHNVLTAEVQVRGDQPAIHMTAEFALSGPLSVEQGQEFRQFLEENGFTAKGVIVGLPAKWLVAKELSIPPANAAALSGILNIQAERAFSLDPKELVFDYYSTDGVGKGGKMLLMAMQRNRLAQIQSFVKAAGLSLLAVTPTSHALRSIVDSKSDMSIYIRNGYIESWSCKTDLPLIRHGSRLSEHRGDKANALMEQIGRLLSLTPGDGHNTDSSHVTLFAGSAKDNATVKKVVGSSSDGVEIDDGDARLLSVGFGAQSRSKIGESCAAAALALAASRDDGLFVDFLHSRMVPGRRMPKTRTLVWAAIASCVVVLALVSVIWGWRRDVNDIATFTEQLAVMSDDIEAAREVVDRMSYASAWTSQRPEFLECLSQLTEAFPEEGTIWATNLALHENRKGLVTGKALREESVLLVLDAIKLNSLFRDVQMVYMRDAGRGTDEVSFAIQFNFSGGS